jgi:hypothetical protein
MSFVLPRKPHDLHFTGDAKALAIPRTKPSGRDVYNAEITPDSKPVIPVAKPPPLPKKVTLLPKPAVPLDDSDEHPTLCGPTAQEMQRTRARPLDEEAMQARRARAMPIPNFRATALPARVEIRATKLTPSSGRRRSIGLYLVGAFLLGLLTFCLTYAVFEPKPAQIVER